MKKTLIAIVLMVLATLVAKAEDVLVTIYDQEERACTTRVTLPVVDGNLRLFISKDDVPKNTKRVTVELLFAEAKVGEEGFYLFPDNALITFRETEDGTEEPDKFLLAAYGISTPRGSYAAIIKGMRFESNLKAEKRSDRYTLKHYFSLKNPVMPEDIVVDFIPLSKEDANYAAIGRIYRKYQLERGACRPIRERIKEQATLDYLLTAPEFRIRQCWKPVPTSVKEQTPETEPPVRVKCTFDQVVDLSHRLKKAGVEKCELCLVGWNLRGHDGRFPTLFPAEPAIGGDKKLKKCVKAVKKDGYRIAAHICSGDAYRVSEDWDEADIAKNPDGSLLHNWYACYGSGNMYQLCYKRSWEKFSQRDHRLVRDKYGFNGMLYNDVFSIIKPPLCYDPAHPVNYYEGAEYANKILGYNRELFGAVASEGGMDFVADNLDLCLYLRFADATTYDAPYISRKTNKPSLHARLVPFWNIVYNGIILSNVASSCVNYPIKEPDHFLRQVEWGGHPVLYLYSCHRDDDKNWMNSKPYSAVADDLRYETEEEIEMTVKAAVKAAADAKKLGYLHKEYMDDHCELAPKVYKSTYSNGHYIVTNYTDAPYLYNGVSVKPHDYHLYTK